MTGRRRRVARWLAVVGIWVVVFPACGRKGPPLPPIYRVADRTRDLSVIQKERSAVLEWSYPQTTADGGSLPDLESISVYRLNLPASQEPAGTGRTVRPQRVNLMEVRAEVIAELGPDDLAAATIGNRLQVQDDLAGWLEARGTDGEDAPQDVLWYAVRSTCCQGRVSDFSNIVRLAPMPPPAPPAGIAGRASPEGVVLTWAADDGGADYQVERRGPDDEWSVVTPAPVAGPEFVDDTAAQGRRWTYRLRVAATTEGGETVLGMPSEPLTVEFDDVYPPPTPEELACLPEEDRVRLRWLAVTEADHYEVVRSGGGAGTLTLAADLDSPLFLDQAPPVGRLVYEVRAVDEAGNRSAPVQCESVIGSVPDPEAP